MAAQGNGLGVDDYNIEFQLLATLFATIIQYLQASKPLRIKNDARTQKLMLASKLTLRLFILSSLQLQRLEYLWSSCGKAGWR